MQMSMGHRSSMYLCTGIVLVTWVLVMLGFWQLGILQIIVCGKEIYHAIQVRKAGDGERRN